MILPFLENWTEKEILIYPVTLITGWEKHKDDIRTSLISIIPTFALCVWFLATAIPTSLINNLFIIIVAKCPGMAGTVPEFRPTSVSRLTQNSTYVPIFFTNLVRLELGVPIIPSLVPRKTS